MEAASGGRLKLVQAPFSSLGEHAEAVDGVVLDIGISSMQVDQADRGFSFRADGPLDMRMAQAGLSAADVVNRFKAADLARIFGLLGEERHAGRIARMIERRRSGKPFLRTTDLAQAIADLVGFPPREKIHPATRVFQALRIYVNDELGELARALVAAERMLKPGGRLVVVTFHSLEDRIVKRFVADRSTDPGRLAASAAEAGGHRDLREAWRRCDAGRGGDSRPIRAPVRRSCARRFARMRRRVRPTPRCSAFRSFPTCARRQRGNALFRTSDMVLIAVMVSAAAFTYKTKQAAEGQAAAVRKLEQQIRFEEDSITLLKADWSLLTQPVAPAEAYRDLSGRSQAAAGRCAPVRHASRRYRCGRSISRQIIGQALRPGPRDGPGTDETKTGAVRQ